MTTGGVAIAEVIRLHEFFDDWFAGDTRRSMVEFSGALDDGFTIITPGGTAMTRDEIVDAVAAGFGAANVRIRVENFHVMELGDTVVCRYDEVQASEGSETRRISTAVMRLDGDTPGGLRWITVHETWADG